MGKTSARARTASVTLDAGALIALDRGDRRMIALLAEAVRGRTIFHVPAGALGQAWRDGATQATLARFLKGEGVRIEALDAHIARASGELCGHSRTRDVIDASVVLCAREHGGVVLTSDPADLRRLDGDLPLERV
ncbi:MAG: PIN domain-containing protein [Deltaproteobacteria bacterium]|nr:PIN domain-containing protein [Deltaproteobacteria bacterium]